MSYVPRLVKRGTGNFFKTYRPMRFDELVGPAAKTIEALTNVLEQHQRMENQTYLFVGDSGSGKTTVAFILGLAMNCRNPQENKITGAKIEPCLECESCKLALSGGLRNTNVSPISLWNSSTISKDQIRSIIDEEIMAPRPLGAKVSVSIFDEAHKLTKEQKSVLLSPMEALPRHSYVFMTTNIKSELLGKGNDEQTKAVLSRFIEVEMPSWSMQDLQHLLTDVVYTEYKHHGKPLVKKGAITEIIHLSQFNARTALGMLQHVMDANLGKKEPVTAGMVRELFPTPENADLSEDERKLYKPLFNAIYNGDPMLAVKTVGALEKARLNPVDISFILNKFLKNRVIENATNGSQKDMELWSRRLRNFNETVMSDNGGEGYARLIYGLVNTVSA